MDSCLAVCLVDSVSSIRCARFATLLMPENTPVKRSCRWTTKNNPIETPSHRAEVRMAAETPPRVMAMIICKCELKYVSL